MNSYLTLAAKVLREARQPLSARQILETAYRLHIVPGDLYGKTQHKTLQARLSEDILKFRGKSEFLRTDPGRFFLRALLQDRALPTRHKREYLAPLRANELKNFYVVCFGRDVVEQLLDSAHRLINPSELDASTIGYAKLSAIINDPEVCFLRVFVILYRGDDILAGRSRSPMGDDIRGNLSIGVSGFVKREDRSLFSEDGFGVLEAASRTLREQLQLQPHEADPSNERFAFAGFLTISTAHHTSNPLCAVLTFRCPLERDIGVWLDRNCNWHDVRSQPNDLDQYDEWSRALISRSLLPSLINASEAEQ